nr:Ail/Lom family outer membrane beta-barrel protein [Escherichia coli]
MVQRVCDGGYGLQPCSTFSGDYLRVTDNKGKTHEC